MTLAKLQKSFYKHLRESFVIHKILIAVLLLGLSSEIYASDSPKITLTAKTNPKSQKVIRKRSQTTIKSLSKATNPKSGGFIGVELGGGIQDFKQTRFQQNADGCYEISSIKSQYLLMANIVGGYQWYFHSNIGIKASGYLGYGYGKMNIIDKTYGIPYDMTRHNINFGLELPLLFDLNFNKHSLGLHFAPLGFDLSYTIFDGKQNATPPLEWKGQRKGSVAIPSYAISAGLHYYNANHQIFLDYKYLINSRYSVEGAEFSLNHLFKIGYAYKFGRGYKIVRKPKPRSLQSNP